MQRVEVVGVADITHLSTSGMNLYIEVDNDSMHRLVVKEGQAPWRYVYPSLPPYRVARW